MLEPCESEKTTGSGICPILRVENKDNSRELQSHAALPGLLGTDQMP